MTPEEEAYAVYQLALRWLLIDTDWEIGKDGRVRALRQRPASWTDAEVALLTEYFAKNPFPGPREAQHVLRVVTGRRIERIFAEKVPDPRPKWVAPNEDGNWDDTVWETWAEQAESEWPPDEEEA